MMEMQIVESENAPKAVGPYSQAVRAGDLLFASGQIPLDPKTQEMVENNIKVQTERVLQNLEAVLKKAGLKFDRVVKATCYLKDLNDFAAFNEIYQKYMGSHKPARVTIQAAKLPKDALVEIDVIAAF